MSQTILIGINLGFITNSSSVVHHFPLELLEHAEIAAFMKAMGIETGFVGRELWSRSDCATIAVSRTQKLEARDKIQSFYEDDDEGLGGPTINADDPSTFVIIYGDEYESVASTLASMLRAVAHELGLDHTSQDYN